MKKVYFKSILLAAMAVLSFFTFSCDIGMGVAVDMEAPVLTVESPSNNAFVPRNFSIEGIATDNIGCEKIRFDYKYKINGTEYTGTKECGVDGDRFSCPFTFDKDVEVSFEITALDKNRNGSEYSSASKTYIIDSNDPKVGKVAIRRGAYTARLLPLEDFKTEYTGKTALRNNPENKDYFQNKSFVLYSTLKDSYGIGGAKIELYEGSAKIIEKTMPDDTENKFSPEFSFTESELVAARPSLATGVHYIKPVLVARDTAGNIVRDEKEYFAFESAYDVPHVKYNTMIGDADNGGKITVGVGGSVPITVFDDDGIASIRYKFVKASEFTTVDVVSEVTVKNGLRDKSFDLTAPDVDGPYKLVMKIADTNSPATEYLKAIDLKVTNGDAATIIIESPQENSVPSLSAGNFTIKGYTIDNQPVGKIAVAWLPAGNADIAKAEEFFNTYDFSADATPDGTSAIKMKVYKLTSVSASDYDGKKKNTFSKTFKFFDDFKDNSGAVLNDAKVFMFACKDATDNVTIKTFRLNKFTSRPSFKVEYSYDNSEWNTSTDPLVMCKLLKTYFKITPVTENNMPIESCTVSNSINNGSGFTQTQAFVKSQYEYVKFELTDGASGAPQSGKQFNLILYAEDKLGNATTNNLTIAFEEVGELQTIEADYTNGSILTAGEILRLQANFSHRVTVDTNGETNIPYIQLSGTDFKYKDGTAVDEKDRRAYLKSGNESNTLYFEYKIPDDIELEAKNITIPTDNSIKLNGSKVEGVFTKTGVGTAFNNKKICLDSIAPYIVSYSPAKNGVVESSVTDGVRSVKISLTFNEPVEIESGSLVLQRTAGWYIPPVIREDVFLKLYNGDAAIKNTTLRKYLCGSTSNVRTDTSTDRLGIATMLPDGPYMQFTQGLDLTGTNALPDISTKYVLKYDYNIGDTTSGSVVSNIRNTLETLGYHKAEFDVQTFVKSNNNKTLTLTVTDSDFIDCLKNGVEYSLSLTAESIRDAAYNYLAKSKTVGGKDYAIAPKDNAVEPEYKFYVGPVATPVIRVNRKATNAYNDAPTGKTDIKIDCETPGVTMSWGSQINEADAVRYAFSNNDFTDGNKNKIKPSVLPVEHTAAAETTVSAVKALECDKTISDIVYGTAEIKNAVGDGSMDKASKTYIKAQATKVGMSASAEGYEGAFKTMLRYEEPSYYTVDWNDGDGNGTRPGQNTYRGTEFRVFGAQIPEGGSYTSGWPLTQNVKEHRYQYQIAYKGTTGSNYYWESWQILTQFCMQTNSTNGNFQQPANPNCGYGEYIYGYRVKY